MLMNIYENSIFTVCSNFLAPRECRGETIYYIVEGSARTKSLMHLFIEGPLGQRAGCLQERHLSERILHIWPNQIWIWECNSRIRESNAYGLMFHEDIRPTDFPWRKLDFRYDGGSKKDGILDVWDRILIDYSRRITFDTDRLPTISGIASKI